MKPALRLVPWMLRRCLRLELFLVAIILALGIPAQLGSGAGTVAGVMGALSALLLGSGLGSECHGLSLCRRPRVVPGMGYSPLLASLLALSGLAMIFAPFSATAGVVVLMAGGAGLAAGLLLGWRYIILPVLTVIWLPAWTGHSVDRALLELLSNPPGLAALGVLAAMALVVHVRRAGGGQPFTGSQSGPADALIAQPGLERHGRLFDVRTTPVWGLLAFVAGGLVSQGRSEETVSVLDVSAWSGEIVVGYITLGSMMGLLIVVCGPLYRCRRYLRRLALMPGWARARIFRHAEASLIRFAGCLLGLAAGWYLLAGWLLEVEASRLVLEFSGLSMMMAVLIPLSLLINSSTHRGEVMVGHFGLILATLVFTIIHLIAAGNAESLVTAGTIAVVVAMLALGLRMMARRAWMATSLERFDDWPLVGRSAEYRKAK